MFHLRVYLHVQYIILWVLMFSLLEKRYNILYIPHLD